MSKGIKVQAISEEDDLQSASDQFKFVYQTARNSFSQLTKNRPMISKISVKPELPKAT